MLTVTKMFNTENLSGGFPDKFEPNGTQISIKSIKNEKYAISESGLP